MALGKLSLKILKLSQLKERTSPNTSPWSSNKFTGIYISVNAKYWKQCYELKSQFPTEIKKAEKQWLCPICPNYSCFILISVLFAPEFPLSSFCKVVGPTTYSKITHLRLDGNNLTRADLPQEMYNCLRVAAEISLEWDTWGHPVPFQGQ